MATENNKKQIKMGYLQASSLLGIIEKIMELNPNDSLNITDFFDTKQLRECANEVNMRLSRIGLVEKKYLQTIDEKNLTYEILRQE